MRIPTPDPAIAPYEKGIGLLDRPIDPAAILHLGWNLLHEDLSLPVAVLYHDKLEHNLRWMQQFIAAYGMKLAPHGKTTMAPRLFQMQLQTGAWAITLATAHQTRIAYLHGVRRVLMANQLVGRQNIAIIADLLRDPSFEYFCLVDSPENIDQLGAHFRTAATPLNVLIEIGATGGRAGIRDDTHLYAVLAALDRWRGSIVLCGVELFEGVLKDEPEIRAFLSRAVAVTQELLRQNRFHRQPAILTGAGSAWYDVVAEIFSAAGLGDQVDLILRPGCYLTHDIGSYQSAQQRILTRNPIARRMHSALEPALQVWACVQSIPENATAIVTFGKRDAAFDSGFPVPASHYRPGACAPNPAPPHWTITRMMDQHAFLRISAGDDIRVGDMLAFDISHPCLTFDKWRVLPILDAGYRVIDIVQTYF